MLAVNSTPDVLAHHDEGIAVIAPGELGAPFTGTHLDTLLPQLLVAVTHTLPVLNVPKVTLIDDEPWPVLIVAPDGTLHV